MKAQPRSAIILFLIVNLGFSAVQVDAYIVEPLLVETTELSLTSTDLNSASPPVRVVHLGDIHIERNSFRETQVIKKVNALAPDIIILTGDYLNLSRLSDPTSAAHFRQFVAQLDAPHGIYAVRGTVEPTLESMAWLVEGTDVVWLEQEAVTVDVRGQSVTLVGAACSHRQELDAARLAQAMDGIPTDAFTLLLYHSPDLISEATEHRVDQGCSVLVLKGRTGLKEPVLDCFLAPALPVSRRCGLPNSLCQPRTEQPCRVDLYLGGHTHGGQFRLPFYGAIITNSMYGKRYASGLFEEGGGMPRARFLCRPEIVSIELDGSQ